ncbi:Thermolysin metallopeptidase, catalytic domain [Cognatiyoonia koreensis]|uniref:Neutral metalloproteinase n=1 Tax=Cognatiyoonia koreensis TaxID=364200 RepID=A0A1I0Q424_9RHOB|nr:M4 family metallopeptidase [Cognatiyoonia koreensis]SEW21741.1 Thermolysin metallopeptidase, catalytic domain [Cognatiyoonia koreensis]
MCMCHNPINCIVPPHMLDVMMLRGDKSVRKMAESLMKVSDSVREDRAAHSGSGVVPTAAGAGTFVSRALALGAADAHTCDRRVHDGDEKAALPGNLVRGEGDAATGDEEVDRAYDGAGDVFNLYSEEFDRNSIDGFGMPIVQTVHHRRNYNNAFWNGEQMAYGDGDGEIFQTFTELSVIAHEISHGVVQHSGGLIYQGQSGALNESYADVFGAMTQQRSQGQDVYQADWLVGKGILGPNINGVALRSMKAPGTAYSDALLGQDPQPYHMDFYVNTTSDNGGVHINSGIPNHAFYLYCMYLGGNAWERPGQIWYKALQKINNPHATFGDWAAQTLDASIELYGAGSYEMMMLRRAWNLVGIDI